MNRINLHEIYELSSSLHPLTNWSKETTKLSLFLDTWRVIEQLEGLRQGRLVKLRNQEPVNALIEAIKKSLSADTEEAGKDFRTQKVEAYQVRQIATLASKLEIILANEFPLFHSFLISEKGILSIDALINHPERIFSDTMIQKLEAMDGSPLDDFKESARCLAFGFATACGFHIVRCAEAVLRKWHKLINSSAMFKTEWGPCVDKIRVENKSERDPELKRRIDSVLDVLVQIKNIHRNPLMHPEISLEESEAEMLFNLTTSAIFAMMGHISREEQSSNNRGEALPTPREV